ncbi:hypothetical protein NUW58_g5342 [Xylaria curta]|uniref:Uncharacterized protein n=1 Tax=Xylaria curta TaxID=42375 RepID=A0ACC1P2T5_9PEZI|nr:hypothetical protein NUW58_g5342 [Xylaria curta]
MRRQTTQHDTVTSPSRQINHPQLPAYLRVPDLKLRLLDHYPATAPEAPATTMDNFSLDNADLDKLNDKDKAELRQVLQNENQKARIQSTVHGLADVCFRKCVTGTIKNGKLDKTEEGCMANCAERFFDISTLTMKQLQNLRQS